MQQRKTLNEQLNDCIEDITNLETDLNNFEKRIDVYKEMAEKSKDKNKNPEKVLNDLQNQINDALGNLSSLKSKLSVDRIPKLTNLDHQKAIEKFYTNEPTETPTPNKGRVATEQLLTDLQSAKKQTQVIRNKLDGAGGLHSQLDNVALHSSDFKNLTSALIDEVENNLMKEEKTSQKSSSSLVASRLNTSKNTIPNRAKISDQTKGISKAKHIRAKSNILGETKVNEKQESKEKAKIDVEQTKTRRLKT